VSKRNATHNRIGLLTAVTIVINK